MTKNAEKLKIKVYAFRVRGTDITDWDGNENGQKWLKIEIFRV